MDFMVNSLKKTIEILKKILKTKHFYIENKKKNP